MLPANALIPIRDENPTRTLSVVAISLIVANIGFFFLEPELGMRETCKLVQFFFRWGVVPKEFDQGQPFTGNVCPGFPLLDKNIYLSLITSMFLHGGPIHLAGNMLFLWIFGNNIEDILGKVRFLAFYMLTGILAGLAHIAFNLDSPTPTIGASGAVSGLLGAYIVLFPKARVLTIIPIWYLLFRPIAMPAALVLGVWFLSQFFIGQGQQAGEAGVAWVAHVGGFIAGTVLIFVFGGWQRRNRAAHPS